MDGANIDHTERPDHKANRKRGQPGDQVPQRRAGVVELAGDHGGETSENLEVIPLDHRACRRCNHRSPQALLAHLRGRRHGLSLHTHKTSPLFGKSF
jgi:hypothetical protein